MIEVRDVHKRYLTDHGPGPWVLRGINLSLPPGLSVGLIGCNGAGKSTLLRLIGGIDQPTRGSVHRHCRVSWPMGFGGGLQGSLSGRQNARFLCRVYGRAQDMAERIERIEAFADIGPQFDAPVKTYSTGMKSRLHFALSLAFDFDVYISDEITSAGDADFRGKARRAFADLVGRASLIMTSHQPAALKEFCTAGIWLKDGQAHWFDQIGEALLAYRKGAVA